MNQVIKLAEKGFSAEEISSHLDIPLELVQQALESKTRGGKLIAREAIEDGLEKGFDDLTSLAFDAVKEVLEEGRFADKRDVAKFILKQRLGVYRPPAASSGNVTLILQQFNDRVEKGKQLANKDQEAAIDV